MNILPADYIEEVGLDAFKEKPIGTGAFILEEWIRGDRLYFNPIRTISLVPRPMIP